MSVFPPPSTAPAGWYVDPEGSGGLRYFDGQQWWPVEEPTEPTLPVRTAVIVVGILIVSLVVARVVAVALVEIGAPVLVAVAVLSVIGYGPALVWSLRVARRHGAGRWGSGLGVRARPIDLVWGPLVWLAAVVVQVAIAVVLIATGVPFGSNVEGIEETADGSGMVIALVITAVVMAPVVEEIVFRGVVQRALASRWSIPLAVVGQGILFGLIHVDPALGLGNLGLVAILTGVGITFGGSVALIGRITPAIIGHAIFNAVVVVVALTGLVDRLEESAPMSTPSGGPSVVDRQVVDQADVVDPGGDDRQESGRRGVVLGGDETIAIDDVEVLDA